MKSVKSFGLLFLVIFLAATLGACKKDTPKKMEKNITGGSWKVTNFSEDGSNETSNFAGYSFEFSDNGTVVATNGGSSVSGSWSTADGSSDDDSNSDLNFNLTFPEVNNFDELSDDWHVTSQSDSKIELNDVSGGNGGTDYLTFEKN